MMSPPARFAFLYTVEAWILGVVAGCLLLGAGASWWFINEYEGRFYRGLSIDGLDVSGLTIEEARAQLTQNSEALPVYTVTLAVDDIAVSSTSAELGARRTFTRAIDQAYAVGRTGSLLHRVKELLQARRTPRQFESRMVYHEGAVKNLVEGLASQVNIEGTSPAAILHTTNNPNSLVITPGKPGRAVKEAETLTLVYNVVQPDEVHLNAPVASTGGQLTEDQVTAARTRAEKFVGHTITFTAQEENLTRTLKDQDLVSFLTLPEGFADIQLTNVIATWSAQLNRPAQDAEFSYDPQTLVVSNFTPHRNGLTLDESTTREQLLERLATIEYAAPEQEKSTTPIAFVMTKTEPARTLADTNPLGIKELIGFGDSEYDHSIPTRIHNVAHTAKKINLTLIPPDQEFSFNKTLGEVSRATGFQPAYVIKNGRTELGDGGGVCQVSTTLFRAVLNAGLPVTKRKAHSYRVSYYELNSKPGIDATVYAGDVDLRFKNDTGHHVLVYTETDSEDLYMKVELYGTSDGRTAEIVNHEVWDFRPAPAPVYIPDPSLPPGARRQVDWSVGGVKAKFTNVVKDKDGNVIREEEYYSNYVPWSAKYLVGI